MNLTTPDDDNLWTEDTHNFEDDIPSAQAQRLKPRTNDKHEINQPKEKPSTSSHQRNNFCRKRHQKNKSTKTNTSNGEKRARQELNSIQEKIHSLKSSIGFLKNHLEKWTCFKTLRCNA